MALYPCLKNGRLETGAPNLSLPPLPFSRLLLMGTPFIHSERVVRSCCCPVLFIRIVFALSFLIIIRVEDNNYGVQGWILKKCGTVPMFEKGSLGEKIDFTQVSSNVLCYLHPQPHQVGRLDVGGGASHPWDPSSNHSWRFVLEFSRVCQY